MLPAIVDINCSLPLEREDSFDLDRHGGLGRVYGSVWVALSSLYPFFNRPSQRQIAVCWIMGRGLIGDHVRNDAAREYVAKYFSGVANEPYRNRTALRLARSMIVNASSRLVVDALR